MLGFFILEDMNPKKIAEYRKLLDVTKTATLKELKTIYRNSMKEDHPDTIADAEERLQAEERSKNVIEAYHFLVSIAPETQEANLEEYLISTSKSKIVDFQHKGLLLEITFACGTTYEYFGVNQQLFTKFVNSGQRSNFARRKLYTSFLYRKSKKAVEMA